MKRSVHIKIMSFHWGYTHFRSFGLGFNVDRFSLTVEIGPLWIAVEW